MKKDDVVTLRIEDLSSEGLGIGHSNGFALFIKDTVIGDVAEVKVMKMKKNCGFARLQRIVEPSPDRIEAVCPQARRCGGCQIQEMRYDAQLRFKEQKVRNNLQRIGGFENPPMEPIIGMEQPYRYRNKAQFPIGRDKEGKLIAGFYAGRTHTIIDCHDCLLGAPVNKTILEIVLKHMETWNIPPYDEATGTGLVRHIMTRVGKASPKGTTAVADEKGNPMRATSSEGQAVCTQRELPEPQAEGKIVNTQTRDSLFGGEIMVCVIINGTSLPHSDLLVKALRAIPGMASISLNINRDRTNVIMGHQTKLLWGRPYIEDSIGNIRFRISPLSFYQVNSRQTEKLYSKALEYAGLTGGETVWDLYCGIGTISLFVAQKAGKVYGVEIIPDAIEDAKENARLNDITNAEFFVGKAEEVLPRKYQQEGISADVIIVDPPRKGCDQAVLNVMLKIRPERIVYVSCDSATLARDLRYLCDGGYEVRKVCPVEMFGGSVHVETVVLLSQRKPDDTIEVDLDLDELDITAAEKKATYREIQEYVLKKYNLKVSNLYISQVKRKCGLEVGENYNLSKKENQKIPQCPQDKEAAIRDALNYFAMTRILPE